MYHSLESLLAPHQALWESMPDPPPCGPDLEYDFHYLELFSKLIPKENKVVSGELGNERLESALEPVRWTEVEQQCRQLLQRSHDVRLLVIFTRCLVQHAQWQGLLQGLALLLTLLRAHPAELHPALMQDNEPDTLPRTHALAALTDAQGLLGDVRGLPLDGNGRLPLRVRDVESALTRPHVDNILTPDSARRLLADMWHKKATHCLALLDALELTRHIETEMRPLLGDDFCLTALDALLEKLAAGFGQPPAHSPQQQAPAQDSTDQKQEHSTEEKSPSALPHLPADPANTAAIIQERPDASLPMQTETQATSATKPKNPYSITHRQEAKARIRDARLWFEEHEPSSPVSLLLRKAEHLVGKRFPEVMDVLPRETWEQWDQDS